MSKNTTGRFIWHELTTPDPKRALAFYGELFAWKAQEIDMGPMGKYTMLKAGEHDVGGMVALDGKSGAPPHWQAYVTADVDAATKRAQTLGAKVHVPPTDIPNVGRFSVIADPQGAVIAPFRSNDERAELTGLPPLGTFCWDELITTDPKAALKFYEDVLGWTHDEMDMGPMGTYYMVKRGDKQAAGIMKAQDPSAPPFWLSYVVVDDVDGATKRGEGLKAKVIVPPADIPNIGRFSILSDPLGAVFATFKGTGKQ
jgi:hypothetical protein